MAAGYDGASGVSEAQATQIRAAAAGADVRFVPSRADLLDHITEAEIVFGYVPPEALARAQRLRWVQSAAAGPNALLYPAMLASDVLVTSCKGNGAIPLAEHAMLLMLMLNRNALHWVRAQAEHRWDRVYHAELTGLTCGIIGLGHSGQDLAAKAKAFHMRVIGMRRSDQPTPHVDEIYPRARLHDFLGASDVVVVTAPLTPETRGLLGEAEFRAMKPTAHYICFSRGGIADDAALLRALQEGWIAGAGLDAHTIEPLPPDSPFWTAPNTIVTPHNGATTALTRQRGIDIFVDNLHRYQDGRPLLNLVDKAAGY
ncbi:MAG: D-2-hydroxyacid dehydrogenase [Chloroflexi bacterium]|nr:D-2-hydroxyacid dehydrogenase [Chloroflexota bacterium]